MEMVVKGGNFMNLTIGYQDVCLGANKNAHTPWKNTSAFVNMHFIY